MFSSRLTSEGRGRLAPSPTGFLHVGNAATFLLAWLSAHAQCGEVVLRMEDIDRARVKPGYRDAQLADLTWLGLHWAGEPLVQSERLAVYRSHLQTLIQQNRVYPCTCTRREIALASAPHEGATGVPADTEPGYPGTCAYRQANDATGLEKPFAWRYRLPEEAISITDELLGPKLFTKQELGGDFVLWRGEQPSYQLAVVVDDIFQGITEVVRGRDLLPSAARQKLLYREFQTETPAYYHTPLFLDDRGERLAKRNDSTRLANLREQGLTAESVLGRLAAKLGLQATPEPVSLRELQKSFAWPKVTKQDVIWAEE